MSFSNCRCESADLAIRASADPALRSPGQPLESSARDFMESRFGEDFGAVRLHTDSLATESAQKLSARAYTYGQHIVFGRGAYAGLQGESKERLAHELAHVVQQRQPGGAELNTAQREGEARSAGKAVILGGKMPRLSSATPALSRDPEPGAASSEEDASFQATLAEATCDIPTLCSLSLSAPTVVTRVRLLQAYTQCHPHVSPSSLVGGNPCLTPNLGLPTPAPAQGPRRAPGPTASPGPSPSPSSGGGLSLPSTTIRFNLGPAAFTVDLPASLAIRLPVPFRGAQRVVFALNASPDEFSFRATINAAEHVRIIANAAMTTAGRGSAGLTVQTTRTICQAVNPAAARSALESAGTRLRDAIQAVQTPPTPDPEASEVSRTFAPHARYAEVVAAVAHLHSEIERIQAPCREVPVASFDFGVQGQLTETEDPEDRTPTSIGGSLRIHF